VQNYILRIIDANCDRIGEGLRFLEEVARFIFNDATLSKQLKGMRHNIIKSVDKFGLDLISGRDSVNDVGARLKISSHRQSLTSLVIANAKRVEQGLRVMEDLAKLPELSPFLSSEVYQQARFSLYELERDLVSRLSRRQKLSLLTGLYVILDSQVLGERDIIDAAARVIEGGATIIQFRDKRSEKGQLLKTAQKIKKICKDSTTLFIINDHLDIALAVDADGLHIGQDDLPLSVVRKLLSIDKIVGCSTHTLRQAQKAVTEGADYIAIGSIFPTSTKSDATVVGLTQLKNTRKHISVPIVAIGGINRDNINKVFSAGADSAAVISAILTQENIAEATRQMVKRIAQKRKTNKEPGKNC